MKPPKIVGDTTRAKQIDTLERQLSEAKANPLRQNELESYELLIELFKNWQKEENEITNKQE
jgi:hypothetical protein